MDYRKFYRDAITKLTGRVPEAKDSMSETEFDSLCQYPVPQALKDYYLVAGRHEINDGVVTINALAHLHDEAGYIFFAEDENGLVGMAFKAEEARLPDPDVYTALFAGSKTSWMPPSKETVSETIVRLFTGALMFPPSNQQEKTKKNVRNVKDELKKYIRAKLPQFTVNTEMIVPRGILFYEWEAGLHDGLRFFLSIQSDPYDKNKFTYNVYWQSSPGKNLGMIFSPLSSLDGDVRIGMLRHVITEKSPQGHYEDLWWRYDKSMDGKPFNECLPTALSAFVDWVIPFYQDMIQYKQGGYKSELLSNLDAFIQQ